jgi:ATP-independent RNA helicase DbpA
MSIVNFSDLGLSQELLLVTQELGLTKPTHIQSQGIPVILKGSDLIGESRTGSGKTLAFAMPILEKLELKDRTIQALIITPTRELANQVAKEIRKLGRKREGLQIVVLSGGLPIREQAQTLENGAHIAVGTPGRILDLLSRQKLNLDGLKTLVLDEADKMLEMGFEEEMNQVLSFVPKNRQTLLFSATFPEAIKILSQKIQNSPVHIKIEESDPSEIQEFIYEFENDYKKEVLMRVLKTYPAKATLIFCNQKATVDELAEELGRQKAAVAALHGDIEQRERDTVTSLFRNQSLRILVATDVAARGLDIENLELVINYDLPNSPETYVHRIGRTGRMNKSGVAVSLAKPLETLKIFEFEKFTGRKMQRPSLGFKNQLGLTQSEGMAAMQTLSISGGRKHKIRAGDILGALTKDAGLTAAEVGKIEIFDRHSYVAIASSQIQKAFDHLRDGRIKGQKFQVKRK